MKPLTRAFCKMFRKVELVWCHATKCDSSPIRRVVTLPSVGLHPAEHQELAGPCSCTESVLKRLLLPGHGYVLDKPAFHIAHFSQPLFS